MAIVSDGREGRWMERYEGTEADSEASQHVGTQTSVRQPPVAASLADVWPSELALRRMCVRVQTHAVWQCIIRLSLELGAESACAMERTTTFPHFSPPYTTFMIRMPHSYAV